MKKIRVLLAEDHIIVRQGICSLLNSQEDIEVVGEASNGREALELTKRLRPNIAIMDISMPLLNGLEAIRQIKKSTPETRIIVLTIHSDEEYVFQAFRVGAAGYLVKTTAFADLLSAIRAVNQGDAFLSPSVSKLVLTEFLRKTQADGEAAEESPLTEREREVLQLIAEGHTTKEIAALLSLSIKTAKRHRENIMSKLGIHDVAGLTRYALRKKLIGQL